MSSKDTQFKKGHKPWNKGIEGIHLNPATEFKEGVLVGETHPSWKGGVQKNKVDCTYLWLGNKKRGRRPRIIYEENFGAIPSGYVIIHKDGNKDNDHYTNLEAISRKENLIRNQNK